MARMLCFLGLVLLLLARAYAEEAMPKIIVFGNRSLKPDTVIRMSGLYQDSRLEAAEVKKRLQTTNMFARVEVFRDENMITIFVREKMTWFVVPYFSKDPSASIYGLAFGKSTFLGTDASLVGRYQIGTGNREASLLFRDETLLETPWIVGASADYEDALHRIYQGREVVHRTQNELFGGSFQLGYRLTPHTSLALNNYIERHRFEEPTGEYFSGIQWSTRLQYELSNFYVDEGLSEGAALRAYVERTAFYSDFHFWKTGLSSAVGVYRKGDLNWILRGRAEYSPSLPRYQLFELGNYRLRGFPAQQFRDHYYGVVQNDVLLTSAAVWVLRLRPLVFGDWGFIEGQPRSAAGGGLQVYIKDIAIPAIQFFFGYGFNPNGFSASAAIGPQL